MHILLRVTRTERVEMETTKEPQKMFISSVISRYGIDKLLDTRPSIEKNKRKKKNAQ